MGHKKCRKCGEPLTTQKKYCSLECYLNNHRVSFECLVCKKTVIVQKAQFHYKPRKYCSYECSHQGRRTVGFRKCRKCGKVFVGKPGKPNKYCSHKCYWKGMKMPEEILKERARERVRRYRRENREWYLEQKRKRRRLELRAEGSHSKEEFQELKKKCGYRCVLCGKKKKLQRDHIVPLCKGGSNYISNIQPVCASCNSKKWTRVIKGKGTVRTA